MDIWSLGCIIAELHQKCPLFKSDSDIEQLCVVIKSLGHPDEQWAKDMPDYNKISFNIDDNDSKNTQWAQFTNSDVNNQVIELVRNTCRYEHRWPASKCLELDLFSEFKRRGVDINLLPKPDTIKQTSCGPKYNQSD